MLRIDLNCDVGEASDPAQSAVEELVLRHVTSVSIACGYHAGDPNLIRRTLSLARAHGVAVGAHPGFRDPEGFGRREIALPPSDVESLIAYQVSALAGVAALEGLRLSHVKPHGALYNRAARDRAVAQAIARAVKVVDRRLILFGLAGSRLVEAAREIGLAAAEEAFADRAYRPDGTLVPRTEPGSVIHEEALVIERVLRMVREGLVCSLDGTDLRLRVETICLHADTPGADRLAERLRRALVEAGVRMAAVGVEKDAHA